MITPAQRMKTIDLLTTGSESQKKIAFLVGISLASVGRIKGKLPMKELDEKQRICLKHGGLFRSDGPGNRICLHCKKRRRSSPTPMRLHAFV